MTLRKMVAKLDEHGVGDDNEVKLEAKGRGNGDRFWVGVWAGVMGMLIARVIDFWLLTG